MKYGWGNSRAAPEKKEADFINDSLRSEFHSTREKKEANFINDSLRSEFHRKFMNKYIK